MPKVLIAEDEVVFRGQCRKALEAAGHQVIEAEDGRQAVRLARVENPDLVVMDLSMPGMDGMEALERMNDLRVRPPAVIFSNYQTCKSNYTFWGAQAYVQNTGLDFTNLLAAIHGVLKERPVEAAA
jgi:two-component system KDP operon response regulator KdpE